MEKRPSPPGKAIRPDEMKSHSVDRVPPPSIPVADKRGSETAEKGPGHDLAVAFPIVGIVASAGGLDAFKKFFSVMPADSGIAFVLIPHLDPSHESLMVELLSKWTSMPVVEAKHGMRVQVNSVYVIPPNFFLSISSGLLQLSEPPKERGFRTSIDFFLRSLAQDQGERSIGIVLSGTGSHGALGVREIKLAGGMVIAQQPDTAEYDQMPQSAIDTGVVDCVLAPGEMPAALVQYVQQPYLSSASNLATVPEQSADQLNQVLTLLQSRTKYDFRPYRKPMVLRRIQRRMGLSHIDSMVNYLELLEQRPEEVTALYKDLMISVTAFFRDPEAFRVLEQELIPVLLARRSGNSPIRVWVPGCATGEEAYSIAMLLFEGIDAGKATASHPALPADDSAMRDGQEGSSEVYDPARIQIFASDIDADAIEVARIGIYPASILGDVSPEQLRRFFVMVDAHHYQINKQIRDSVVFSHQNLISDAPFSKLDLISCRNLLIYLEPEMQQKVVSLFHFALSADGYLLLGTSETIGRSTDLFETVSKKWRVYRRIGSMKRELVNIPLGRTEDRRSLLPHHLPHAPHRKSFKELTEQLVLNEYGPAAALVSRKLEVLYVTGPLVNYLEFPRGELSKDLLTMARPGLRTKLRVTCNNAIRDGKAAVDVDARVKRDGQYVPCSITVRPLTEPKEAEGLMLVLFEDRAPWLADLAHDSKTGTSEAEVLQSQQLRLDQQFEFELKAMSEELQSTIEEMESSNEELKTSNEEIMSVNEELQSVNEELETSKEELQSLNEELSTVNSELRDKVAELDKATGDLMNLMSSTEIATIFLDEDLNIKRFTSPTTNLLNLRPTDIGRPLRDIAPKFADDKMMLECQKVLENLIPVEQEVQTPEPRYYCRRILPYRTTDHQLGGVVITFVDLTQRKQAEAIQRETDARHFAELHESAERMQAILNAAADAIVTFDRNGKIDSVNLATETLFDYQRDELIGKNISLLVPSIFGTQQNEPNADQIEQAVERFIGNLQEVLARRKTGSTFPADLVISRVDHLNIFSAILRDISLRKQLQAHILEIASEEQRRIGQELHDGTQQELAGLSLSAGALCNFIRSATPTTTPNGVDWSLRDKDFQRIKQTAAKLLQGLQEANHHVRALSHGIMPVQIDAEGLRSALAELTSTTNEQEQVRCRFEFSGSGTIANNSIATQLYRIAQESLSNALKHGHADEILISLSMQADQIILEVIDNGVGFDSQLAQFAASGCIGIGLRIMEYRASTIGGVLEIDKNEGGGTTVRCTVSV